MAIVLRNRLPGERRGHALCDGAGRFGESLIREIRKSKKMLDFS